MLWKNFSGDFRVVQEQDPRISALVSTLLNNEYQFFLQFFLKYFDPESIVQHFS
jgi:hypothetical protein